MILIVDDEPNLVDMMSQILQDEGFAVTTAQDGVEALEAMRDGLRPCLTFVDLMMPRMSGWELRAQMLADPTLADIPVAIVSAFSASADMEALRPAAVLPKPFSLHDVLAVADEHCRSGPVPPGDGFAAAGAS